MLNDGGVDGRPRAAAGDGKFRSAQQEGGDVELDAVNEAEIERLSEDLRSAFDEDAGDAATGEVAQDGPETALFIHEGAVAAPVGEKVGLRGEISRARENYAPWLTEAADAADGQARVIGAEGSGADQDGIDLGAQAVGIEAGRLAREPRALGGKADDAGIQGDRAFGDDEGEAGDDPFVEGAIEGGGFGGKNAVNDFNAGRAEPLEAAARMGGIGVDGRDDDAREPGGDNGIDAGRRTAMGGSGLEGDVEGCAARQAGMGETAERLNLRMGGAGGTMPAPREKPPPRGDDNGANSRIGAGASHAAASFAEGEAHPGFVGWHERRKFGWEG